MPLGVIASPLWLYNEDNHVFDGMELPTSPTNEYSSVDYPDLLRPVQNLYSFDRNAFINYLLMQTAEFSTIYPEPEAFADAVSIWSKTRIKIWQQMYNTLFFRYNPLWNKDGKIQRSESEIRNFANALTVSGSMVYGKDVVTTYGHPTETLTRTGGKRETVTDTRVSREAHTGTDTTTDTFAHTETEGYNQYIETHSITQDDTTGSVAAFNSSSFENRDKTQHVLTETNSPSGSKVKTLGGQPDTSALQHGETVERTALSGTLVTDSEYNAGGEVETKTFTGTDETHETNSGTDTHGETRSGSDTGTGSRTDNSTEQGNIGVMSTMELIERERKLLKFNIYEFILDDFKQNFCVLIY